VLQSETVIAVTPPGGTGKWMGRDGFVAEAAVQIDRINATVARLERELDKARATIAEMAEEASRTRRFQAFEVSLENSRDYKISDVQRSCKDLKGRLDAIEGDRSTFAGLTYKSFGAIDRKLAELSALQTCLAAAEGAARRNEVLFFGALAVAALSLASRFVF
jgi:chromosome segregation ATPase